MKRAGENKLSMHSRFAQRRRPLQSLSATYYSPNMTREVYRNCIIGLVVILSCLLCGSGACQGAQVGGAPFKEITALRLGESLLRPTYIRYLWIVLGLAAAAFLLLILFSLILRNQVRAKTTELIKTNLLLKEEAHERETAEQNLKESERKYRALVETTDTGFVIIDHEGQVIDANSEYVRLTGRHDLKEILGRSVIEWTASNEREKNEAAVKRCFRQGYIRNLEIDYTDAQGNITPIEINASVVELGGVRKIITLCRDISERRKAVHDLRQSESKYRLLTEKMEDIVWTTGLNLEITYISPSVEKVLGFTQEERMKQTVTERLTPASLKIARDLLYDQLKLEKEGGVDPDRTVSVDLEYLRKDGSSVLMENLISAIRDDEGKIIGLHGVSRDITRRRQAEKAVQDSEKEYRATVDAMSDALHVVDRDLHILLMNKAFKKWNRELDIHEEPEGKTIFELYPFLPAVLRDEYEKVFTTGEPLVTEEETMLDDAKIYTETRKIPVFEGDKVARIITIVRNITERKNSEQERERLQDQLTQAQKMEAIGTLAGGIAHDFNNILMAIIGYSQLAMDNLSDPAKAMRDLKEVLKAGDRAKDLVGQILTFSRKSEATRSPLALHIVVKESLRMLRSMIPTTIEIRQNLVDSGLVMSNQTQIHQIMINLCTNAAHAMEERGGVLEVGLRRVDMDHSAARTTGLTPGPYLQLTVSDTGHGMSPEIVERIFEPYFTTKEQGRGTGLGLSVVHGIVKSHGGAVVCRSVTGGGTSFDIYFPRIGSEKEPSRSRPWKDLPVGTERILFVDDELVLTKMVEKILGNLGYSVVTRTSSMEALDLFRKDPAGFDLVITDMTMPGMTGDKLAQKLIEIRPDIPIIMCSGYSSTISDKDIARIGIREFILKPLEAGSLATITRRVLDAK